MRSWGIRKLCGPVAFPCMCKAQVLVKEKVNVYFNLWGNLLMLEINAST